MANKGQTRIFAGAANSLLKSGHRTNGGLYRCHAGSDSHWQSLTAGLPQNVDVYVIVVHPQNSDVIFVGTQDGPYRSIDGGDHWERLGFPERGAVVWSMIIHPTRPNVMYAGTAPIGLYRSEDGGDTWRKLANVKSTDHCGPSYLSRLIRIGIEAGRPDEIYLGLEVSGVLHSADAGETWQDLSAPLIKLAEQPHLKSNLGGTGDHEGMMDSHAIVLSAAAPKSAFLAVRVGIFRTDDGGASWQDMQVGRFSPVTYCRDLKVSQHDPRVMYACMSPYARSKDGSLYRSDDIGVTWKRLDHGIKANGTMMSVAEHPADPAQVYCVSRAGEVFGTEDAGATWTTYRNPVAAMDGYAVACI